MTAINIKPINRQQLSIRIVGTSPMIQHQWSEKAKTMMREKHQGKKTKNRDVRDPVQEFKDATYQTEDGRYGVPVSGLKKCLIGAAHKDIGLDKVLVRKSLFILCDDVGGVLPMECDEPLMREDLVRVGAGSADLRYRPEFRNWTVELAIEFDGDLLQPNDILTLFDRAGFGVGLCESRPEKSGENGRFKVDESFEVSITGKAA